jgi:hypothetical protein
MQRKTTWAELPEAIRAQASARWRVASLGDGFLYRWVAEAPPTDYRGPLPFGRLLRRFRQTPGGLYATR